MCKSIFSSLVFSHMLLEAAVFISFQLIRRIVGPNKDDSYQCSQMRFLICNLCVKCHMLPFSDFYAIFTCRSVSKKFVLSKCQSAKYAGKQL